MVLFDLRGLYRDQMRITFGIAMRKLLKWRLFEDEITSKSDLKMSGILNEDKIKLGRNVGEIEEKSAEKGLSGKCRESIKS